MTPRVSAQAPGRAQLSLAEMAESVGLGGSTGAGLGVDVETLLSQGHCQLVMRGETSTEDFSVSASSRV